MNSDRGKAQKADPAVPTKNSVLNGIEQLHELTLEAMPIATTRCLCSILNAITLEDARPVNSVKSSRNQRAILSVRLPIPETCANLVAIEWFS